MSWKRGWRTVTDRIRGRVLTAICVVTIPVLLAVWLLFGTPAAQPTAALQLTEIMNHNLSCVADADGQYYDWVELTNTGDSPVSLKGLSLTDNPTEPHAFDFNTQILQPREAMVIPLTGDSNEHRDGYAPFGLNSSGDTVYLYRNDTVLDCLTVGESPENVSYGIHEGKAVWFASPTPGAVNGGLTAPTPEALEEVCYTGILINEVAAISRASTQRPFPHDWIELYNTTTHDISLEGYRLTDDATAEGLVFGKQTIAAGGYLSVPCSEEPGDGGVSAPFAVSPFGETLSLYTPSGVLCDRFESGKQRNGVTAGRVDGVRQSRAYFTTPTPGAANSEGLVGYAPMPTANRVGGYAKATDTVTLTVPPSCQVYYTTNGRTPTDADTRYTDGTVLSLTNSTVLRAVAYRTGYLPSDVMTHTYLTVQPHTLPVVSVSGDPVALFGTNGVFTDYLDETHEATVHTEYFTADGVRAVTFDSLLRISGGLSRYNVQKAFSLNLNQTVGDTSVTYPFFEDAATDTFHNLLLRPSGSDWNSAKLRDEFVAAALDGETGFIIQAMQPVALYINGTYHGLYYLREKRNEAFVSAETGIPEESVHLAKSPALYENTTMDADMAALVRYARTHDLTVDEQYRYVTDRIDEHSLMRYYAAQTWFGNGDVINNMAYYRDTRDNEWHWIVFDADWACTAYYANHPFIEQLYHGTGKHTYRNYYDPLMTALLQNKTFQREFLSIYKSMMETTLSAERLLPILDNLAASIENEIPRQYARYGAPSVTKWTNQINYIRTFVSQRQATITQQLLTVFSLTEEDWASLT